MATTLSLGSTTKPTPTRNLNTALLVIALAQLMVVLDTAIVNIALPSIQRALQFTPTGLEWVVNGYSLAFGGLLLLGGRAGDLLGRRPVFVAGVLLFTAGSLGGGLATTAAWLVAARVVQGIGGAIVAPTALSLVADTFPEGPARNRAFGVYSAVSGAGGAAGLLLGGLITNSLSWRWVLFINVPIGLVLAVAAPRVLVATHRRPGRLDLPGAVSVTAAMALLVYGLTRPAGSGWTDGFTLMLLGAAAVLLAAFIVIELRTQQALMPLRIFASRTRSGAYLVRFALGATLSAVLFFLTQYLQNVLGYNAIQAGLAFLPITIGVIIGAQLASRFISRVGPRRLMAGGGVFVAAGTFWLSRITEHSSYTSDVLGAVVILAVGLGLTFVSTTIAAVAGTESRDSGLGSALLNVGQQLGGSVGLAVLGTIAVTTTRNNIGFGVPVGAALAHAVTLGYAMAFGVASLIGLGGFAIALVVVRGRARRAPVGVMPDAA